jgi:acyl-CoA dehydrogenase
MGDMAEIGISKSQDNKVLQAGHRPSTNFYTSDTVLHAHLAGQLSADALAYLNPLLDRLGTQAATEMDEFSLTADKNGPQLIKRDKWGETIDAIRFHPSYWALMQIAVESEMLRLKWEPSLRKRFTGQRHRMGFALGMLYAMSESGQYCPLCMTDGVAHLIDQFCEPADRDRLLPHIYTNRLHDFYTGAMFLTEKAGGSDVGANIVQATDLGDGNYSLHGEKWFCSNVNAQLIFALARTRAEVAGTRGLSIFLIERQLSDGQPNPIEIVRLKDKLGTRSMASGECMLDGTIAKMVGPEFQGFRVMTEMINLSRMYNSVAALAGGRRALVEAYQFLNYRMSFGKIALAHALVRSKLWELGALHLASFHLVWRAIAAMDAAEAGGADEAELLRLLTPMVKRDSAELAVYLCRESMELMGGMGYIEDTVVPKVMRDVMVLPIWEGAGNIMVLDMLRAAAKSRGLACIVGEIKGICQGDSPAATTIAAIVDELARQLAALSGKSQDEMEYQAKPLFLRLTRCYQAALLLQQSQDDSTGRYELALEWVLQDLTHASSRTTAPSRAAIASLMGWEF